MRGEGCGGEPRPQTPRPVQMGLYLARIHCHRFPNPHVVAVVVPRHEESVVVFERFAPRNGRHGRKPKPLCLLWHGRNHSGQGCWLRGRQEYAPKSLQRIEGRSSPSRSTLWLA